MSPQQPSRRGSSSDQDPDVPKSVVRQLRRLRAARASAKRTLAQDAAAGSIRSAAQACADAVVPRTGEHWWIGIGMPEGESTDSLQERGGQFPWAVIQAKRKQWETVNEEASAVWIAHYWVPLRVAILAFDPHPKWLQSSGPRDPIQRQMHHLFLSFLRRPHLTHVGTRLARLRSALGEDRFELRHYFSWLLQRFNHHTIRPSNRAARAPRPESNRKSEESTQTRRVPLTDAERDCLSALYLLNASDQPRRKSAAEITRKVRGPMASRSFQKSVLSDLKQRGLVRAQLGRGGGYWLTTKGSRRAAAVAPPA